MNAQTFHTIGYVSVALWACAPLLWAVHFLFRRRWVCHSAVAVVVGALVCAEINSATHVDRIQIDRSKEIAEAQARQEAARQAALKALQGDAAQIQFAEDSAGERMDVAGMDEAESEYLLSLQESAVPEWKEDKKTRSQPPQQDDSIEAMLDTTEQEKGIDDAVAGEVAAEPILMLEKEAMLANRLDAANLKVIRFLLLLNLVLIVFDYLRRANISGAAYCPLPLPSAWRNTFTPLPPVREGQAGPGVLAEITRRGEPFLYCTDTPDSASTIPQTLCRWPRERGPIDILRVEPGTPALDDDFVFETLWHGRASCVVADPARAEQLLTRIIALLAERRSTRAHARQTVHVLWDLSEPPPQATLDAFARLGAATGWTILRRTTNELS